MRQEYLPPKDRKKNLLGLIGLIIVLALVLVVRYRYGITGHSPFQGL